PALEEVGVRAREPRVRRAQEREEVAPLAIEPRVAQQAQQRLAEGGLAETDAALERVRHAECREGGVESGAPAVERGTDDRDPLGGGSCAQQLEDLVRQQLQR